MGVDYILWNGVGSRSYDFSRVWWVMTTPSTLKIRAVPSKNRLGLLALSVYREKIWMEKIWCSVNNNVLYYSDQRLCCIFLHTHAHTHTHTHTHTQTRTHAHTITGVHLVARLWDSIYAKKEQRIHHDHWVPAVSLQQPVHYFFKT